MTRRHLDDEDLPNLDRPELQSIFRPLDPSEPAVEDQPNLSRFQDNPMNLVWIPAVVGLLTFDVWLRLPMPIIFLSLVVLTVILVALWKMVDKKM